MLGPWDGASAVQAHETKPPSYRKKDVAAICQVAKGDKSCQAMGEGDVKARE